MDEMRFLRAGDHPWTDAGLPLDLRQELAAVSRFARRARCRGENLVDAVRIGQPLEFGERLQRGGHRVGGQRLAVEPARAKPDHDLFAIDDFERQILAHAHDDHVDGVGADVDGRDAHV
jgi:hypothetical protein